MIKKNNFNCLHLFLSLTVAILLISCKKEEPSKFSGDNFLYFKNVISNNIRAVYRAERSFSFFQPKFQVDTIYMNDTSFSPTGYIDFPLTIQVDGKLHDQNRGVLLQVEGDGIDYSVLPPKDSIYIKANHLEYILNLKLIRPSLSDTGMKTLTLWLKNNDHFSPEKHIWNKITYRFGNSLIPPSLGPAFKNELGAFSSAKMHAMQIAVDRVGAAVWKNDPDLIMINSDFKRRGEKEIHFDPFTLDDLYCFLVDIDSFFEEEAPISGIVKNAYASVLKKMIVLSNELIKERRAGGNPILDDSGNEISFPL